jgi:hypothetical protein
MIVGMIFFREHPIGHRPRRTEPFQLFPVEPEGDEVIVPGGQNEHILGHPI